MVACARDEARSLAIDKDGGAAGSVGGVDGVALNEQTAPSMMVDDFAHKVC